jgi:hypothetical protein
MTAGIEHHVPVDIVLRNIGAGRAARAAGGGGDVIATAIWTRPTTCSSSEAEDSMD